MKSLLVLLLVVASPSFARAQFTGLVPSGPEPPDVPDVVRLTVDPAAEPQPALRYSLLPKYGDLKPGNAAPYYYRALLQYQQTFGRLSQMTEEDRERLNFDTRWDEWEDLSDEEYPREKARLVVDAFQNVFESLRTAAGRETCDWELRFRDLRGLDAIAFVLVEFQEMRSLARLLIVKVRLEILEGRHEEAIRTMQVLYRMAQDTARVPTLINDLIGIAITSMTREQVHHLIASPGSPNLYWALATLPEPFIDLREAMQQEALLAENIFPFLRDADTADRTPEEWDHVVRRASSQMDDLVGYTYLGRSPETAVLADFAAAARVAKGFTAAKRRLIETGYDGAEVSAMPIGRVIALDGQRTYRHTRDELFKWSLVPARSGWIAGRATEKQLRDQGYLGSERDGGSREVLPIASTLMPAIGAVAVADVRTHRDRNALRVIEALRMYAAEHGAWPASLAHVTAVPLPDNPYTDAPFGYELKGQIAHLAVDVPEGQSRISLARIYELTLRGR